MEMSKLSVLGIVSLARIAIQVKTLPMHKATAVPCARLRHAP